MTTTNIINQPAKTHEARTAVSRLPAKVATSTATSHQPLDILNYAAPTRDYSIQHKCRAALLDFFAKHDSFNLRNPISRRLLELVSSDDLDDQSKQELTQVFIHSPPTEPVFDLKAKKLGEFRKPPANDPAELLKHRYLCKGGGLLLVGATGLGKSSLAMQLAIKWALGQACDVQSGETGHAPDIVGQDERGTPGCFFQPQNANEFMAL